MQFVLPDFYSAGILLHVRAEAGEYAWASSKSSNSELGWQPIPETLYLELQSFYLARSAGLDTKRLAKTRKIVANCNGLLVFPLETMQWALHQLERLSRLRDVRANSKLDDIRSRVKLAAEHTGPDAPVLTFQAWEVRTIVDAIDSALRRVE